MAGTRFNGVTNEDIELQYQFTLNNVNYEPFAVTKVEIFPTLSDAENDTNVIETITVYTTDGTGLITYTMASVLDAGQYVDKITIEPNEGDDPFVAYNYVYVRELDFGGAPPEYPAVCQVYFWVMDLQRNLLRNAKIECELVEPEKTNSYYVTAQKSTIYTNASGFAYINIVRSSETESVHCKITISYRQFSNSFKSIGTYVIPNADVKNFVELVAV